jgi:hypothetical protein
MTSSVAAAIGWSALHSIRCSEQRGAALKAGRRLAGRDVEAAALERPMQQLAATGPPRMKHRQVGAQYRAIGEHGVEVYHHRIGAVRSRHPVET